MSVGLAACVATLWLAGGAPAQPRETWKGQPDTVRALAVSPDGKTLASCTRDAKVTLWDLAAGKKTATLVSDQPMGVGFAVGFTPDGKSLVVVGQAAAKHGENPATFVNLYTVKVWDLAAQKVRLTIDNPEGVGGMLITPDGKSLIAVGLNTGKVLLYDLGTGKPSEEYELDKGFGGACAMALSPDGKTLAAAACDGAIVLWDVEKKAVRATIPAGSYHPGARVLAFSPDSKTLATAGGGDGSVLLWNAANAKPAGSLDFTPRLIPLVIAFSPDGKSLAVGGDRWGVGLWDLAAGGERDDFEGDLHAGIVYCAVFTPDGKTLITADSNNTKAIWFWDVPQGRPQALKPAGQLTPAEAKQLKDLSH